MSRIPLRWHSQDRALWRDAPCVVEYVAEDGVLISYRRPGEQLRFAIVDPRELELPLPRNGRATS